MIVLTFARVAADCEGVHAGWPDQPVNTFSSLAFVAVGVWVVAKGREPTARMFGTALGLVGLGSVLFHGGFGEFGRWLHDVSIVWLLLVMLAFEGHRAATAVAMAAAAALVWSWSEADEFLAMALVVLVVVRHLREHSAFRRRALFASAALLTAGFALSALGRTGGEWCAADSPLQPHAAWHVLAAVGLALYASARGWVGSNTHNKGGTVAS